jgi:hypothetical protein
VLPMGWDNVMRLIGNRARLSKRAMLLRRPHKFTFGRRNPWEMSAFGPIYRARERKALPPAACGDYG